MSERTQNKIKEFKAFTTEEKKQKLLAVFEYIKDSVDFAPGAIAYLQDSPEDLGMDVLYETVMEYTDYLKDEEDKRKQAQKEKLVQEADSAKLDDNNDAEKLLLELENLV